VPGEQITRRTRSHNKSEGTANFMILFSLTNQQADFYVQLKGQNAGRPVWEKPSSNYIGIKTNPDLLIPKFCYYRFLNAYNSGHFKKHLKGSVIPYIKHKDVIEGYFGL